MQVDITQIWQEHHDKLLAFIRKQVKQKEVAEDLLHDVFLKIRDKIGQLKDHEKLQSWMFQLTRNVVIDYFRKQSRQTDPEWDDENETEREKNRMDEAENWIGSYILNLPENYREAVVFIRAGRKVDCRYCRPASNQLYQCTGAGSARTTKH